MLVIFYIFKPVPKKVNPDFKKLYRLYDKKTGFALADVMCRHNEKLNERELTIVSLSDFMKSSKLSDYDIVNLQKPIFIKPPSLWLINTL